jgi:hypothetical protein
LHQQVRQCSGQADTQTRTLNIPHESLPALDGYSNC